MSMQGKVIAITGGASGIGLATAKLIATRGATVAIGDLDPIALEAAEAHFKPLGNSFSVTKVDVSKRKEVESWIDGIVEKFGRLDGAANAAGIIGKHHGVRTVAELDDDEWDKIIAVNLTGLMYSLRAELNKISDHGSIVNITSIQGVMGQFPPFPLFKISNKLLGFPGSGAYVASKHGVIGLTRSASKEVGNRAIRVNAVAPGSIITPLLKAAQDLNPEEANRPTSMKRQGTAEECAGVVAFLLGPESSYVTGSVYGVDGGWDK